MKYGQPKRQSNLERLTLNAAGISTYSKAFRAHLRKPSVRGISRIGALERFRTIRRASSKILQPRFSRCSKVIWGNLPRFSHDPTARSLPQSLPAIDNMEGQTYTSL